MNGMGFRVIKTAIAALMAVLIADGLGVHGATSAGLLAILGVDVTRKRSIRSISARFFASVVGLLFASVLFLLFGFHYWVLALYILTAFPIIVRAGFKEGIVTGSVVVFRVFSEGVVDTHTLLTQLYLLLIGLGSAMIVNLIYMPRTDNTMLEIRHHIDETFSVIFSNISRTLREPGFVWNGQEIIDAEMAIAKGITEAGRSLENQVINPKEDWKIYFYMRKQQLESIQYMLQLVSQMYEHMPQGELMADLFEQLSKDVLTEHYTGRTEKLSELVGNKFKEMELPNSREEFEVRSAILQLNRELERFLKIAKKDKAPAPTEHRASPFPS